MTYRYTVFGLVVDSCLELPELLPGEGHPDIDIRWGLVPVVLEESRKTTRSFQAKPGVLLLTAPQVARILVSNGNEVVVELLPEAKEIMVRSFILGSTFAALLHQRGLLPLHASGIRAGEKCVLFCGRRGTGKSTLASIFMQRGYVLHADDICVIGVNPEGKPLVYPAYPQLKLWGETLEKMGQKPAAYRPVLSFPDKFAVPAPHFNPEPLPIKKIFILSPHDFEHIEITPITGINKYKALKFQTFRRKFPEGLGTVESHFNTAAIVGKQVPMYRVHRPKNQFLLNELADILEKNILAGE